MNPVGVEAMSDQGESADGVLTPAPAASPEVQILPIVEERLLLGKRQVVTGKVRVRSVTDEFEQPIRQSLDTETVDVERIAIDRLIEPGEAAPSLRTEGDVTILPIFEEVLVVEKRLLLKEELRIGRRHTTDMTDTSVVLRKQRAVIERLAPDSADALQDEPSPDTRSRTENNHD